MKETKKAIGTLENLKSLAKYNMYKSSVYSCPETAQEAINACELAISALEKQLAKKPIVETKTDYRVSHKFRYCPNCNNILEPIPLKYCSNCGQALEV